MNCIVYLSEFSFHLAKKKRFSKLAYLIFAFDEKKIMLMVFNL